ncbi:MAG: hypothetical protein QOG18_483 [Microbacteriaceae bacterium]|nr:sensor histidine kinase [Microbacteriaceae bacterium]MDQ1525870.1 hypothetical protein [Microbacteriaceae bacterium]
MTHTSSAGAVSSDAPDRSERLRAALSLLEDSEAEGAALKDAQAATLNDLEDAAVERAFLLDAQAALLNILDDSAMDRSNANDAFKASLNILSELQDEKVLSAARAKQLAAANADLEESNSELEQFAYAASHDLSEPLRAISGPVSLLAHRYQGQLDADADEYITFVVEGCARMQTIINDLLAYSRVGRIEDTARAVDLDALLTSILAGLREAITETGAEVSVEPLPTLHAEATQLVSLFHNLLSNALKFVAPGVPPRITVASRPIGDTVEFSVTDNGIGIDPAYRERVFGMFKRLHSRDQYPGTGIGLALAKKIVERHGGTIDFEDAPGGGTRFWFTLDLREGS